MSAESRSDQLARIRQERDLYLRLLSLGAQREIEPFLKEALALIVAITGARQGYLELHAEEEGSEPAWWIGHDCSSEDIKGIRAAISRGIILEALATGQTVVTPSAMLDPRFRDRGSVQLQRLEAVLCAPIGSDPTLGVMYLRGAERAGPFSDESRARAELFATHVAPLVERLLLRRRTREATDPIRTLRERLRLEGVVGRSQALALVLEQAAQVAPLDVNVLLTGGSGTGKGQLARVIHDNGPRGAHPFVELNCATLPETLIENELFGSHAGGHSAAQRPIQGKVSAAERGTLLLDEIGELPLPAQAKLLQLLQSKLYYPLGAPDPVRADVRLIAATNTDLEEAVKERRFREDLFYRLQVLPIRLPSLAERREDVAELARHFCAQASIRHSLQRLELSPGAIRAIEAAEWPGNIRQLANALEAALIRAAGGGASRVEQRHVFLTAAEAAGDQEEEALTFQEATRRFQRGLLSQTLEETGWNVTETARRLDLARSHVYNLIRAFEFERDRESARADTDD
jgi:Nif-specific regulatory protein